MKPCTKRGGQVRRVSAVFAVAALAVGGVLAGAGTASAQSDLASAQVLPRDDVCGYYPMGMYRHCDNGSGSTVMLDVRDIFFSLYHVCVGPGVTNLQPYIRWRVIDAWWNGGVGCVPGFYGDA